MPDSLTPDSFFIPVLSLNGIRRSICCAIQIFKFRQYKIYVIIPYTSPKNKKGGILEVKIINTLQTKPLKLTKIWKKLWYKKTRNPLKQRTPSFWS